jgi:hypothetical protein
MNRKGIVLLILCLVIAVFGVLMVRNLFSAPYIPRRPANLPRDARFVGGADGGNWIACASTGDGRLTCIVFDVATGSPRFERSMRICPNLFAREAWSKAMLNLRYMDAETATFDGVVALVDRPDRYFKRPGDSTEDVAREHEISEKYFKQFGVDHGCERINTHVLETTR